MEKLAILAGTFLGYMLKPLAPVIVDILAAAIRKGLTDTAEDSNAPQELVDHLRSRIPK